MGLQDNVLKLKGIGAKRAQLLEKLAINTVSDLLKFYPKQSSYTFLENIVPLKTAENYQTALFLTRVVGIQTRQSRQRLKYTNIIVKDSSGYAEILLFASQTYQAKILKPGGKVAILTFHSGEDRIVKKTFKEMKNSGVYEDVCRNVIRPTKEECHRNSRAKSTKMRWAIKAK